MTEPQLQSTGLLDRCYMKLSQELHTDLVSREYKKQIQGWNNSLQNKHCKTTVQKGFDIDLLGRDYMSELLNQSIGLESKEHKMPKQELLEMRNKYRLDKEYMKQIPEGNKSLLGKCYMKGI